MTIQARANRFMPPNRCYPPSPCIAAAGIIGHDGRMAGSRPLLNVVHGGCCRLQLKEVRFKRLTLKAVLHKLENKEQSKRSRGGCPER